jgi:hypothetical protein
MTTDKDQRKVTELSRPECDIRVWSAACTHSDYKTEGDRHLCASCGTIVSLNHEVRHVPFPHISGDDDNLS